MGNIISVVPVFDIQTVRKAVVIINPRVRNFSTEGQALTIIKAICGWAPLFPIALEKSKPPGKRRTNGCPEILYS